MIWNVLKVLWNDRKSYMGIFVEQIVVFVVLMLCVVSVATVLEQYYAPGMLDTQNTVGFGYIISDVSSETENLKREDVRTIVETVIANIKKLPYVEEITSSKGVVPYMRSHAWYDSVRVDGKTLLVNWRASDEAGAKVFHPDIVEGDWLTGDVLEDGSFTCVVTSQLVDNLKWGQALGRKIIYEGKTFTVIGILSGIKHAAFELSEPTGIVDLNKISNNHRYGEFCARVQPGKEKDFTLAYYKEFNRLLPMKNVQAYVAEMQKAKKQFMSMLTINLYLQAIPTLFLLFFAFIGTLGLFLQHTETRVHEFAVRLSVGSTTRNLLTLVILESIVVTLLASIPGVLLSFFIYDYTVIEVTGIAVTLGVMLLFSVLSAWFPAYKVTKINPAVALK